MNGCRWVGFAVLGVCLAGTGSAEAQAPPVPQPGSGVQREQRYQLAVMEGVLEAAVQQGARVVSRQWRSVSPDVLFMSGSARARGFRLESYGVFFDVEVPSMSQTFVYTWRMLERDAAGAAALQVLKGNLRTPADAAQRVELDRAVRMLERQVVPAGRTAGVQTAVAGTDPALVSGMGAPPRAVPPVAQALPTDAALAVLPGEDPNAAYTTEVKSALIDAMLDHSHALTVAADEWLTVAAHDASDRRLGAGPEYESVTMLIRIKGGDLEAFRAGRLSRADARQRIEIREY